jgi:hypothetical protein
MVLRLSELLERIRPAGAPGAPGEGERLREEAVEARELAEIAAVLKVFEDEADKIVAAGQEQAGRIRQRAERQANQIRAGLPDRIATAQANATEESQHRGEAERSRLAEEVATEVARLETLSQEHVPRLVSAAVDAIWACLGAAESSRNENQP